MRCEMGVFLRNVNPFRGLVAVLFSSVFLHPSSFAVDLTKDLEDPMYIEKLGVFTSRTSADVGGYFQFRQIVSYGFSDRLSIAADVRYKEFSDDDTDGFSNVGIRAVYRAGEGKSGATDIIAAFGFGGQGIIPNYSDEVYSIGVRTGRQWAGITLSATIMTNWVFKEYGMAFIDFVPEAYFRLKNDWSFGLGATLRKATLGQYEQEWINARLGTLVGRTGWFMNVGYEIGGGDFRVGGNINMMF